MTTGPEPAGRPAWTVHSRGPEAPLPEAVWTPSLGEPLPPIPPRYSFCNTYWARLCRGLCSSVAQLCLTLCDPMDCSTPGFPVHHQLLELAQTHDH